MLCQVFNMVSEAMDNKRPGEVMIISKYETLFFGGGGGIMTEDDDDGAKIMTK